MSDKIPARTSKGRDVLLDRNIELDSKLRTVLAQCDGKRDAEQIKARFGTIVDVDAALSALHQLGLVETVSAASIAPPQSGSVLESALGATVGNRMPPPVVTAPIPVPVVPAAAAPAVLAERSQAVSQAVTAQQPAVVVPPAPVAVEAPVGTETDNDPFAEWFPASMRKPKDQAA